MKDSQLLFDRTCHTLYTKPCKKQIQQKIALHYPPERREEVWTRVQLHYVDFLSDWRNDLGGKKNFHNGVGGTYDCIALMAYYVTCRDVTSLSEIEAMEGEIFLPAFRKLRLVNCNRPFFKRLLYCAFWISKKKCDRWGDYQMNVAPFEKDQPIRYEFTSCPTAEFAKRHNLLEVMPALCNVDFEGMELLHARLVRKTTCANGCKCDYAICGSQDDYWKAHPE